MNQNTGATQTSLHISENVVLVVAHEAIRELENAAELANLPGKKSLLSTSADKPVRLNLSEDVAEIDIGIMVNMNCQVRDICEQVQAKVKDAVQNMTGITVSKVNVSVVGVKKMENA